MRYSVVWRRAALDDLAGRWLTADSETRQSITDACNRIDQSLRDNPQDTGEGRGGIERIAFEGPLGILFEVHDEERVSLILEVWRIR